MGKRKKIEQAKGCASAKIMKKKKSQKGRKKEGEEWKTKER